MPFGLTNAPATFQRLMNLLLAGLHWQSCLVYIDNIIILGKTFEQHLHNLENVFRRIRHAGLKLQLAKCHFCKSSVKFLGHVVSKEGVSTDPDKTQRVAQWPCPKSRKELQQFLGFANYYRRFVHHYATIAKPLHQLTEKNKAFVWSPSCQHAFEALASRSLQLQYYHFLISVNH